MFEAGDRVKYIGTVWQSRFGKLATVLDSSDSVVTVKFDGEYRETRVKPSSLESIGKRITMLTATKED